MSAHAPYLRIEVEDSSVGLHGFLVIDTVINRLTAGGLRMTPSVTIEEVEKIRQA